MAMFKNVIICRMLKASDPFSLNPEKLSFKLMPRRAQGKVLRRRPEVKSPIHIINKP